jgi:hypothetical protein
MPEMQPKWPRMKPERPPEAELQYSLEQWAPNDVGVEEVLGRLAHATTARAAFQEACRLRPGRRILLRQATRVIADSDRPADTVAKARTALDDAVADAIAACGSDVMGALRAVLVANEYLEAEIVRLANALGEATEWRRPA